MWFLYTLSSLLWKPTASVTWLQVTPFTTTCVCIALTHTPKPLPENRCMHNCAEHPAPAQLWFLTVHRDNCEKRALELLKCIKRSNLWCFVLPVCQAELFAGHSKWESTECGGQHNVVWILDHMVDSDEATLTLKTGCLYRNTRFDLCKAIHE